MTKEEKTLELNLLIPVLRGGNSIYLRTFTSLGPLNTADRSLAIVDYALRRRFVFVDVKPAFSHSGFEELLKTNEVPDHLIKKIHEKMVDLNNTIAGDDNYENRLLLVIVIFCTPVRHPDIEWYKQVIMNEIGPLLREFGLMMKIKRRKHKEAFT